MPRPKRQRPIWLPSYVPFKDGRYLGLAKQTLLGWSALLLCSLFFTLTVSYASGRSALSQVAVVRTSQSNTLLVLRILSEATAIFLAASIHSTFELVQWVLISCPGGVGLPQVLALQSGTGPLGLLALAFNPLSSEQWPIGSRCLSLLRLVAQLTVPLLGVLIMAQVDIETLYLPIKESVHPSSIGMQPFNHTVASQLGVMQDLFFNLDYTSFLSDPLHAINLAPKSDEAVRCTKGMGGSGQSSCLRHVLVAQKLNHIYAALPPEHQGKSGVVLAQRQQVYSFEYQDNIDRTKSIDHCSGFESGPVEYRICLSEGTDGWLHAFMVSCPANLVRTKGCRDDKSWLSSPGFSTAFRPSFLKATIAYDRISGIILSHNTETAPTPAKVSSVDVLSALRVILNTTVPDLDTPSRQNPILGHPTHFFGRLLAAHLYRISELMDSNPEAHLKGVNALQCLLALTLFYCQNGVLSQTVVYRYPNSTAPRLQNYQTGIFKKKDIKTATIAYAETNYKINVGKDTLIAYTVISGVTIFICLVALIVGSLMELAKLDAEPTLWPAFDFWTQCRVEDSGGKLLSATERTELAWIYDGRDLLRAMGGLKVTRRKRKMRAVEEGDAGVVDDG